MRKQGHNGQYQLQDSFFRPVNQGDCVTDKWNDTWVIDDAAPPHNSGSTGKVYVTHRDENYARVFYPDVLGLKWVLQSDAAALLETAVTVGGLLVDALRSAGSKSEPEAGETTVGFGGTSDTIKSGGGGDFGGGGADDSYAAPDSDSNTSGD